MQIRKYKTTDCPVLAWLFYETVHSVNAKDYTKEQINSWADGKIDISLWDRSFLAHNTIVAEKGGRIVGFGDMDDTGYLDRLFVHKDYQNRGVATAIIFRLEQDAKMQGNKNFTTHASITAKPFFEKRGYVVLKRNIAVRNNIELTNYIMEKHIEL